MGNPFFNILGGPQMSGPLSMLTQLRSDPMSVLRKAGYVIPNNVNNPKDIIQHLMNSGQINQQQVNDAQRTIRQLGFK